MAHTPGPWTVHVWGDKSYEINAALDTVCNVPGFDDDTVDAGNAEANASLIAAAPELLSAMRGSLAFLEWASDWRERDATAVDQEIAFEIGRITRAIAKAEGRGK